MSEKETKWILRPGVLLMLGLLLYVGTYLLARGSGQLLRFTVGSSTGVRVFVATDSAWTEIEDQLSSGAGPSVVFASFQPMPQILNVVFWPLRKLEALILNLVSPSRAVITRIPAPGRTLRMDSPTQTFAKIRGHLRPFAFSKIPNANHAPAKWPPLLLVTHDP